MAVKMYQGIFRVSMHHVPAQHQLDADAVVRIAEELDSGYLSARHYRLSELKGALAAAETKHTELGGGVTLAVDDREPLSFQRNGEVLMQIWRFNMSLLAAGARPIAASEGNPLAGSQGALGVFEVGGGAGEAPESVRWHVTPDQTTHYFLHCVQASSALSPKQLRLAHELFLQKVANKMVEGNFNYESAMGDTLERHSLHGVLFHHGSSSGGVEGAALGLTHKGGGGRSDDVAGHESPDKLHKQINELKRMIERGTSPPKKVRKTCRDFNGPKGCRLSPGQCQYSHTCRVCGGRGHGASTCERRGKGAGGGGGSGPPGGGDE